MSLITRDPLAPRLRDRVGHALRPGWTRGLLIRRVVAVALVVAAAVVGFAGSRADGEFEVLVAAHDLLPGETVGPDDLRPRMMAASAAPGGVLVDADLALGRTVTGRVRGGEILTDTRLLSSHLPADLTGTGDARLVPVRLSDEAITSLLRPGDVVDVLTEDADVLARRAVVALHAGTPETGGIAGGRNAPRPVLLAMDAASAHRVAAAGLDTSLAVVLH
ncbi:flagellar biosynthesis protein FlgA [Gordonia jinghuaiqii]|uniref:SAF domain-containing protein n=1 Tax=Gordonia jinghuaiqii TaxID=2758710 RepID=A0A7D7LZY5_9ACTN|nr:SAF domain-containing protein [Gordonia jinghuaiqii]MCR5978531.1 flagellar biosynthesis protein FlgA [Gordonia jinghuaiqii]QMT02856.1 SAF domain-containing protein [Gordonia jinghuaiqii]